MQLSWTKKEIAALAEYMRKFAAVYDAIIEEMDERSIDAVVAPFGTAVHWFNRAADAIVMKQKPAVEKGMYEAELIRDNPKYKAMLPAKRPRTKDGRHKTAEDVLGVVNKRIKDIEKIYPQTKARRRK